MVNLLWLLYLGNCKTFSFFSVQTTSSASAPKVALVSFFSALWSWTWAEHGAYLEPTGGEQNLCWQLESAAFVHHCYRHESSSIQAARFILHLNLRTSFRATLFYSLTCYYIPRPMPWTAASVYTSLAMPPVLAAFLALFFSTWSCLMHHRLSQRLARHAPNVTKYALL
jgi:hypothetical protein